MVWVRIHTLYVVWVGIHILYVVWVGIHTLYVVGVGIHTLYVAWGGIHTLLPWAILRCLGWNLHSFSVGSCTWFGLDSTLYLSVRVVKIRIRPPWVLPAGLARNSNFFSAFTHIVWRLKIALLFLVWTQSLELGRADSVAGVGSEFTCCCCCFFSTCSDFSWVWFQAPLE